MRYQQVLPNYNLKDFVRYFWILENDCDDLSPKTFKIFSDGCPGLIFQDSNSHFTDQKKDLLPILSVYGQTTKNTSNTSFGKFSTIGVYFYPNALKSIFGIDADELTDQTIDIRLLDAATYNLIDVLLNASSQNARIAIISRYLETQIQKNLNNKHWAVLNSISGIQTSKGTKTIQEIQSDLNVSRRTLERIFNQHIGISPKLFSRITRFQSILMRFRESRLKRLSELAFEHNYSDQSHFIREFKEFSGLLPNRYPTDAREIVENFPIWLK